MNGWIGAFGLCLRARMIAMVFVLVAAACLVPAEAGAVPVVVSSANDGVVSVFSSGAGGALTPLCNPTTTCPTDGASSSPSAVAFSPDGRYVYVGNQDTNSISVYAVGSTGALTAVPCDPTTSCLTGSGPQGIAVDPSGTHLYVSNGISNNVSVFSIGANGALTPLCDPATNCPATGSSAEGLAIDPSGTHLYVANFDSNNVSVFSIGSGGALTSQCDPTTNCPATGMGPSEPVMDPSGAHLYVPSQEGNNVAEFSVGSGAALTALCDPATTSCPATGASAFAAAMDPSGGHLFVANFTSDNLSEFSVGAGGVLSQLCDPTTNCPATSSNAFAAAVDPSGHYLYVPNFTSNNVGIYSIASAGALTAIPCSPASNCQTGSGPGNFSIAVGPDRGPTAGFSTSAAPAGSASNFNAAASTSPDYPIGSYLWSFGDGTSQTASGPTVQHAYAKPGMYTATLLVVDQVGCAQRYVSTGQTASCDGTAKAISTQTIVISPPAVTALKISPHKLSLAGRKVKGACVKPTKKNGANKHCRLPIRLRVNYTLNGGSKVTFALKRQATGRKVRGACVKPTHKNRKHGKCVRLVSVSGSIVKSGIAGSNHFTFNGKIGGHQLGSGTYQLIATPAGGSPRKATFTITV
jgi:DNA-binding beta-propeller fold protein YncE